MRLLSVKAQNFRSVAELDLDLNVDGLVAVVGPNGAGKSTLFSAIEWALYGQRGRTSLPARRDNAPDGEDCWVEVEFEVGGRAYHARRVDGKDAKLIDIAARTNLRLVATRRLDGSRCCSASTATCSVEPSCGLRPSASARGRRLRSTHGSQTSSASSRLPRSRCSGG